LGQGGNAHRSLPTPVETLRGLPRIQSISTGLDFSFALNGIVLEKKNNRLAENDIYNWGKGHHGVFGVGSHADLKVPTLNEGIKEIRDHDGIKVTKIKSCNYSTLALFGLEYFRFKLKVLDDGSLWGWGNNNFGQLGVGHTIGIEQLDIDIDHPTKIEFFEGRRVVDFDVGENMAIVLTGKILNIILSN
jgi:alpha-tubulin suppressor-like RCC1 family protein